MNKTILVTGGTGYIGSHTIVELQLAGYNVIALDNLSNSTISPLHGIRKITGTIPPFELIDCGNLQALKSLFRRRPGIDGIIHFAASKAVGESVRKPLMYYRNNVVSLLNLLEIMPAVGVRPLVFSSSCTVYGQPDVLPVTEDAPIKPAMSPYGNTKQINEVMIRDAIHACNPIQSIILRYFNPIGAHPTAEIGEYPVGVPQNLVPYLTQAAAGIRTELSVFGNDYDTIDGSCMRDYINVVDLARAHVAAINRLLGGTQSDGVETFNLGTGCGVTVLELIRTFESATGVKVPHRIVGRREGDIEKVWADPGRANQVLGWKAVETLEDTLRSAWKWQQALARK
jgi:UDP-glucose 4-epimerase